jgi:hypothetical protein
LGIIGNQLTVQDRRRGIKITECGSDRGKAVSELVAVAAEEAHSS